VPQYLDSQYGWNLKARNNLKLESGIFDFNVVFTKPVVKYNSIEKR
jgi:hypothetical protein